MRNIVLITYSVLTALLLSGCQMVFDIESSGNGKLFLQCIPGASDSTVIQLYRTLPADQVWKTDEMLEQVRIDFKVNGESLNVEHAVERTGTVQPGCWYVDSPIRNGDRVEVAVSADSFEEVSASTSIPDGFPEYEAEVVGNCIRVCFSDSPDTGDIYGVAVLCERTTYYYTEIVEICTVTPETATGSALYTDYGSGFRDIKFNGWTFGDDYSVVRIWRDEVFDSREVTLLFPIGKIEYHPDVWDWHPDDLPQTYRYKLKLYRFSKEFYDYAIALDNAENNSFAKHGLAPASFAFTNVSGGLGVLAGCSLEETGWLSVSDR